MDNDIEVLDAHFVANCKAFATSAWYRIRAKLVEGQKPPTNSAIRKLLCDLRGYLGSGVENSRTDISYIDQIDAVLAQLPE